MRRASAEAAAEVASQGQRLCLSVERLQQGPRGQSPHRHRHAISSDTYRTLFPFQQGECLLLSDGVRLIVPYLPVAVHKLQLQFICDCFTLAGTAAYEQPAAGKHWLAQSRTVSAPRRACELQCILRKPVLTALRKSDMIVCAAAARSPANRAHTLEEAMQEARLAGILADSGSEASQEVGCASPCRGILLTRCRGSFAAACADGMS